MRRKAWHSNGGYERKAQSDVSTLCWWERSIRTCIAARRSLPAPSIISNWSRQASAAGFAAVVTKDHDYSGVMTAALIARNFPELKTKIYSSIVLNNVIGGFNPYAVEHTAAMGGKIVWMPTLAAENHLRWQADGEVGAPGLDRKDTSGRWHPGARRQQSRCATTSKKCSTSSPRTDMVLASGHLHVSETWLVFEEAKRRGVNRMVLTHPEDIVDASMNDVKGIAAMGAFVEHSLCMFIEGSKFKTCTAEDLKQHIDAAGVDQTILCSDLGQTGTFSPLEGFRRGIKLCIDLGYDDAQISSKMVSLNTARALGIEADLPPQH